ncbi:hypothetical protein LC065_18155 [Halobacillus litoralis]|uniref:hypothetical protein n=1 Tax=Halobacillus litoralis TaxID=45668 RepID=UPI001CFD843F|nr:hypothetical protein [Halobacillus litoralis]WLR47414.1 hypothetical protein LC065_18155 [Halobacillus litoralis]
MKKHWLRFSPFFVMPVILGLHMFLSIEDYAVPLGVALSENEHIVERYNWKGNIVAEFPKHGLTTKEEVDLFILESKFKQTFAAVVLLFLVLVYSVVLEYLSRLWKVSLEGVTKIPEKWKAVMIGVIISLYAFAAFRIGTQYIELVHECERLIHKL